MQQYCGILKIDWNERLSTLDQHFIDMKDMKSRQGKKA